MSDKYWNDVEQENLKIANLIYEDSTKINSEEVFKEDLLKEVENSKEKNIRTDRQKIYSMVSAVAACAVLVVTLGYSFNNSRIPMMNNKGHQSEMQNDFSDTETESHKIEASVQNYDDIYKRLYKLYKEKNRYYESEGAIDDGFIFNESIIMEDGASGSDMNASSLSDKDFYDTNEQTEDVHEGDIVKTDGEYIYTLSVDDKNSIYITKVDGIQMTNVSEIKLDDVQNYYWEELYVSENKMIVIGKCSEELHDGIFESNILYDGRYTDDSTVIRIYDIRLKEKPVLVSENKQEGYFVSSRLTGNNLYVISNHYMSKLTREGCVPKINGEYIPSDCVYLPEYIDDVSYTVVTSLDINDSKKFKDNVAVAGGTTDVYVSQENLYLILSGMKEEIIEGDEREQIIKEENLDMNRDEVKINKYEKEYIEDAYQDVEIDKVKGYRYCEIYRNTYRTEIVKYKYDNGKLKFVADETIEGDIEDNLSIDEEKGYLRLVTTSSDYRNCEVRVDVYEGTKFLYHYDEFKSSYDFSEETNNVYVLNEKLNEVAHIGGLAKGERIYSARYFGDYGYFVTFKQTDPLFTVDFTDMENPKIIGELKIPGFSEYLHFYKDDKLLGIGMDADDKGEVSYVKLEMYNILNNAAEQESKYVLKGFQHSESLYSYKAIMVDPEKNIIGFTAESYNYMGKYDYSCYYFLFTYEDGQFKEIMRIDLGEYVYNIRGFYIGEYLYVVDPNEGIQAANYVNADENKDVAKLDF